ncbi:NAD(P)H-dependent oxidoreductase [Vibrio sp. SCSIO 43136]|uniref:NADPH-dependent FMN reductase n=1 Tax=Vibrio sp. SCSIO 43136 TaxID=2819101 RepID=UPI00207643D7|nr:NAD(P)H-dependent oxidoreductase [Vibrio sp. SCSIO 43136]USD67839.1 NAD(P)H-dependent oxidoreductase [Vibrio sp. SCSIO 43136]
MKIIAFGASSSRNSINKHLASYAANQFEGAQVELIDINDYEMPLFSEDREKELGQPQLAQDFFNKLGSADLIIISFAEHNGSYTAAYKNLFDWTSRVNMKVFQGKKVLFLATSPGPGGASSVLASASNSAPYFDANLVGSLSLPSFYDHFDMESAKVTSDEFNQQLATVIKNI